MRIYGEHFNSFKDPNFKKRRAQCRYCQTEMADDVDIRQRHLARCVRLPRAVTRPCAKPFKKYPRSPYCHRCRKKFSSKQELGVHMPSCDFWRCAGCWQSTPKLDKKAHLLVCGFVRCSRCLKKVSRPTYRAHFTACIVRYCSQCMFRTSSKEELKAHVATCPFGQCCRCGTKKILKAEMKTHLMDCDFQKCPRCTKSRIPNAEFEAHKARCSFQLCRQCVRVIRAEEYIQHAKSCSFYRCHRCNTSRIPLPDLKTHFKVCEYRLCEYCHQKTLKDDLGHICFDRSDVSLARTQRKQRENLLNPKIKFPKTPSIEKVMILWSKSSYTTAVLDFEYHSECLAEMKEKGVFQVAIANALGEWIVPPTTINHQIPTLDLSSKGWKVLEAKYNNLPLDGHTKTQLIKAWRMWQASIVKFYGQLSEDETSGLTWDEIALQLRTYTEVRCPSN